MEKTLYGQDVQKALSDAQGNNQNAVDMSDVLLERREVVPRLLTGLVGNSAVTDNLVAGTSFEFDETEEKAALPRGKRYDSDSKMALDQSSNKTHLFKVPSFGSLHNSKPKDWSGRFKPGTKELQDEAYVTEKLMRQADRAYALLTELLYASILTKDVNYTGGYGTGTNFYDEIIGSTRPAAEDLALGTATQFAVVNTMTRAYQSLMQELQSTGDTSQGMALMVCGNTFFNQRLALEAQSDLARPLNNSLDLQSQPIPMDNYGQGVFPYLWFDSMDGHRYINYGAGILSGEKLVADNMGFQIPLGTMNMIGRVFAPAQDIDYVNTAAQESYAWNYTDRRNGVTVIQETNKLVYSRNPKLITHFTTT